MDLKEIKNAYAIEHAYKDWKELQEYHSRNPRGIEDHMNEICIRAQKAALEKAAENVETKIEESYAGSMGNEFGQLYDKYIVVDKESITNPENLIR